MFDWVGIAYADLLTDQRGLHTHATWPNAHDFCRFLSNCESLARPDALYAHATISDFAAHSDWLRSVVLGDPRDPMTASHFHRPPSNTRD
jgi:hypothetical protein